MYISAVVDKYLLEVLENVRLNLTQIYKSYDYNKMFVYLSTPMFCKTVKVNYILHAASLQKMQKRWKSFEAPKKYQGRGQL